jgi:serine/threonine protein kinase|mmetsp:Transcript_40522/g.72789  ORF Transcript_40522/g.72789 Transcript_40522/m.72789 type:complete len:364 (-) Transcript_40522:212-1303(-)|eukprot:CAMPEP_0177777074 /NCGR_PEP_ID=MMETSP0491_2-20121128/15087_1 /TAXON_ID=63592 /ORGANISM="Tetraselmis chuii, Strain PLY429" /LENGTH=363 /DNA_ID=CAMNT_0019295977 /DNA_START=65 /DNA_END=1156 /DNA_ORIENTATION=+
MADDEPVLMERAVTKITETDFDKLYETLKVLGEGGFGEVHLVKDREHGDLFACKHVKVEDEEALELLEREVVNHHRLGYHPNIVTFQEVYRAGEELLIVMELCPGGDLYDYVQSKRRLPEDEARSLFIQILKGLYWCHKQGIVNRDIKLDNILMTEDHSQIKICDFGHSKNTLGSSLAKTALGTPGYIAPEVMTSPTTYDGQKADVWSLGCMLYIMLCGKFPFMDKNQDIMAITMKCLKGEYMQPMHVSEECRAFIQSMLTPDPEKRSSLTELLKHDWIIGGLQQGGSMDSGSLAAGESLADLAISEAENSGIPGRCATVDPTFQANISRDHTAHTEKRVQSMSRQTPKGLKSFFKSLGSSKK